MKSKIDLVPLEGYFKHNMKPTLGYYRVLRGQNNLWCRLILHRKAVNTLDAFEHEKGVVRVCG